MSERYNKAAVLAVQCPKCGALAGEKCRSTSGAKSDEHNARKAVVYPSYRKGLDGKLKRGRVGNLRVFMVQSSRWGAKAVVLGRNVIDAHERYKLALRENLAEYETADDTISVKEIDVTQGDQVIFFREMK